MQNEIEIMRVLRVPPMGKLVISFNNQRYASIDEISEANVRQLMKTAVGELITFAGGYQKLVEAGVAPPLSTVQPAASSTSRENEEAERFINKLEREKEELKSAGPKPPPSLLANMRRPATSETSANKMLSLVEQVDAILQRHLLADPELADHKIHLVQNASGGLIIDVDGKRYERPRDIENPQIQMMIKRALKEWEST